MKGYIHTINRLLPVPTYSGTIIDDMRSGGYVSREVEHVILGSKTGPYSDKDAMVIYDGEDPYIATFLDLPMSVQREMLSTAFRVGEVLFLTNKTSIESGNNFLIIGTNMGIKPSPRMIQTIVNPHFHITIFPQYNQGNTRDISLLTTADNGDYIDDQLGDKFSTKVVEINKDLEEHQRIFCIRPNNILLRSGFMELEKGWTETNIFTLDTPVIDQGNIFTSESNMRQFHDIYSKANIYIRSVILAGNPENRGFGISLVYDAIDKLWKIRLAFMEKNDSQDNGSICESSGHSILRKVTDNTMRVLDTRPYVNSIAQSVFGDPGSISN